MPEAEPIRITDVLMVVVGGVAGSLGRYAITVVLPNAGGIDWPLLLVNVVGALGLGVLIEVLSGRARGGREAAVHRRLRLLLGTGFLGGFTTYSALAVGTLVPQGSGLPAFLQLVVIVLGGLLAAALGTTIAARVGRGRR